jgi:hypothetical protein
MYDMALPFIFVPHTEYNPVSNIPIIRQKMINIILMVWIELISTLFFFIQTAMISKSVGSPIRKAVAEISMLSA